MHLGTAVGDKTLHTVQIPLAVFILPGTQTHAGEVGAVVRFGQVHGAIIFAGGKPGQILSLLFFVTEKADGFGNVLQTENVLQRSVCTGDHFGHHGVNRHREVQAAVLVGQHHAGHFRLGQVGNVLLGQRVIGHGVIFKFRAFFIHRPAAGGNAVAANAADHFQHTPVVVQSIRKIRRCIVAVFGKFKVLFTQRHGIFQIQVPQRKHEVAIVLKKVRHRVFLLTYALALNALIICGITVLRSPQIA